MIHDPQVSRYNLVLNDGSGRNINPVAMVGNDDDRPFQADPLAKGDIPRHSEVVQL